MAEHDPLSQMRSQVDAAYAAADRLVREAEAAARERAGGRCRRPATRASGRTAERSAFPDIAGAGRPARARPLARCRPSWRTSSPTAARELLIALRALIDWWIARLEREPERPVEVEDIPID